MNKVETSLVSLVAAVPGGLLAYGMVMSFLNFASTSPLSFRIVAGITLVTAVLMALLPLAILVYGGPKKVKEVPEAGAATGPLAVSAPHDVVDESGVESIDDLEVEGEVAEESNDADFTMAETYEEFPVEEQGDAEGLETFEEVPVDEIPAEEGEVEMMETFDGMSIEELPAEALFDEEPPAKKKKKK